MTAAALRTSRATPPDTTKPWFQLNIGPRSAMFGGTDLYPNAVYYNGKTYIAFTDGGGNARVAAFDHSSRSVTVSPSIVSGIVVDEHDSPSIIIRQSDQKLVLAVCDHSQSPMYVAISTNAEDVSAWGTATNIASSIGAVNYTYPNLVQLSGESGKIYLFYRDQTNGADLGATLCYSVSTDGGATWSAESQVYTYTSSNKLYWAIDSDSANRIDFVVTDGDAALSETASVYHFYYDGGDYFQTDGTQITSSLPLAPSDLTKIYDGATNGSARAVWAVIHGPDPVATWVAYKSDNTTKVYWYATCSGSTWTVNQVDTTGSAIVAPNFDEGGVTIDRTNTSRVYTAKLISTVWQIMRYVTADGGATWTSTQITSDTNSSDPHLRPYSPKNANSGLPIIWRRGPDWYDSGIEPALAKIIGYPNPTNAF